MGLTPSGAHIVGQIFEPRKQRRECVERRLPVVRTERGPTMARAGFHAAAVTQPGYATQPRDATYSVASAGQVAQAVQRARETTHGSTRRRHRSGQTNKQANIPSIPSKQTNKRNRQTDEHPESHSATAPVCAGTQGVPANPSVPVHHCAAHSATPFRRAVSGTRGRRCYSATQSGSPPQKGRKRIGRGRRRERCARAG